MGHTFSQPTCSWCGGQRHLQATGWPGEYCSTRCRQAAHRHRQTPAPDTEHFDQALRVKLRQIEQAARDTLEALNSTDADSAHALQRAVRLQVLAEHLTPNMVARTKERGASWERIAALLGMSKDNARKKFSQPNRRTPRASLLAPTPARPSQTPAAPCPEADISGDGTDRSSPAAPPAAVPALLASTRSHSDLATVLSSLQRASGLSLRALAGRSNLSPSFLSRMMNGERFPSWKNVAAIARACGADPEVLRRVWEDSTTRRDTPACAPSLASALRYLHLRAGSPTPWAIAVTSNHELDQDYITGLLEGTHSGPWEDIERLVQLLDGEASFFLPLWQSETTTPPASPASAPPPTLPKPPAREESPPPATRVEELLTAFREALGPPRGITANRRCLAAPIPGVSHWSGR
ncbi:helix-turn-helix domain-containing protein [Streptomyces sp. NPDC093094]|uniref:helix-turn-helix domain-containing protein n=1 Tax=Streptomyces sp. NPDC093094 TaxID=3366026 RepID=UPI0037F74BED